MHRTTMKCVKCQGRLTELGVGGVTIDRCENCAGVWFDAKELANVVDHIRANDFAPMSSGPLSEDASGSAHEHHEGACPRCDVALTRTETLSFEGFFYDRCDRCGGAWLDAGELKKIASDDDASAEMAFFTKRRGG